ncbi:MAG: hypothetical protein WCJ18_09545 [Planctomycetota bacterium]
MPAITPAARKHLEVHVRKPEIGGGGHPPGRPLPCVVKVESVPHDLGPDAQRPRD